jgi:hypothetical protein
MKTKQIEAILGHPFKDRFVIKVYRWIKNSKPRKEEIHSYSFDYNSDHIFTVMKRFSEMVRLHHNNVVEYFRELNKTNNV